MIKRYQNLQIEKIWSKNNRGNLWKKIEIYTAEAWAKLDLIAPNELEKIQKLVVDFQKWTAIEEKTKHETSAFVDMLAAQTKEAGQWIHFGLTSNDVLDTAQNFLLFETSTFFLQQINKLLIVIKERAMAEKKTIMVGRTHGMFAEPITMGYKFALWFSELKRHEKRLKIAATEINICKIAGPTGLRPTVPFSVNEYVAEKMGMKVDYASNQLVIRDRLINLVNIWIGLSLTIEKIATEIRNLHRSEINEVTEGLSSNQKGSSAMPHKKNPRISENICGLMRLTRGLATALWSVNIGWHERDLTNSAIERYSLPEMSHLLATGIEKITDVLNNLVINHKKIAQNLNYAFSAVVSHKLMLFLIKNFNFNRNKAYRIVQNLFTEPNLKKEEIWKKIKNSENMAQISIEDWEKISDPKEYLTRIEEIFIKIFSVKNF